MIEVKTRLGIEAQKKLSRFMLRNAFIKPLNLILYGFIFVLGVLFCVMSFVIETDTKLLFYGILLIAIAFVFPLIIILTFTLVSKNTAKSSKYLHEPSEIYFRFDPQTLYCETTQTGAITASNTMPYAHLFKAFENETDFFLFISNAAAYVLPKNDFITGTPDQLRQLLQSWLGPKYKIKV